MDGRLAAALNGAEGIDALTSAAQDLLADEGWIARLIAGAADALRRDPFFAVPYRAARNDLRAGLLVHDRPGLSITLDIVDAAALAAKKSRPRSGSIGFTGDINLIRFVKAGSATLSFWEAPRIGPDFRAATAGTCRETGRRTVADGEILIVDGRHQSFIIEAARSNLMLVNATIRTDAPVSAEYDAATGDYLGCSAAAERDSRLQMVATLARLLGAQEAFPAIAALLDHPSFFVRWHAMRELIGIDAEAARPYLRLLATHDPHADVRETAGATLDMLLGPAETRDAA